METQATCRYFHKCLALVGAYWKPGRNGRWMPRIRAQALPHILPWCSVSDHAGNAVWHASVWHRYRPGRVGGALRTLSSQVMATTQCLTA
ncbi:hypothetical protein IG631_06020 [Alternaria alternata]|nr:hypothetical protein IG631_06020 [Alternaria alternata]